MARAPLSSSRRRGLLRAVDASPRDTRMLLEAFLDASRQAPRTLAVDDGRLALNYRQLARLASILRGVVASESREPHVGIMLPAGAAFPAALFGTLWASRVAVPLNFLLAAEELRPIVEDAGLDVIVTVRHFESLVSQLPARAIYLEDLSLKRRMFWAMWRPLPRAPRTRQDDTAVLLYTSGTTAAPKGVKLSHRNLHSNAADTIHSLEFPTPLRFLNILPPFHVYGLTGNVLVPVLLKGSVFAIPRFKPAAVAKAIEQHAITIILAIPSMYAALLKAKSATREAYRSIQVGMSGGEPLSDSVRAAFEQRFGICLLEGYGLTETSPLLSACSVSARRTGSVGRPIRNVELRLIDENGALVSDGADGEILVRGPGVTSGYYNKPDETAAAFDDDGWFKTGDIGRIDADGFLFITGRAKDMMIVGGENVFPREIEAVLEEHPGVLQAAVIGEADESRGEVPIAFVLRAPDADVTEQALRRRARESLAGFKVPRKVHIRDELPQGPTGKILKRRLRELLD